MTAAKVDSAPKLSSFEAAGRAALGLQEDSRLYGAFAIGSMKFSGQRCFADAGRAKDGNAWRLDRLDHANGIDSS